MKLEEIAVPAERERRIKSFLIPERYVLSLLAGLDRNTFIKVPKFKLPADAVIRSVHYSWLHDAFVFVVASIEYDSLPDGVAIEPERAWWEVVHLDRQDTARLDWLEKGRHPETLLALAGEADLRLAIDQKMEVDP